MNRMSRCVGFALGWLCLCVSLDASACGNSMRHRVPPLRMLVEVPDEVFTPRIQRAEEALRSGQYTLASTELDAIGGKLREAPALLRARFERVAALISVRTDGGWPLQKREIQNTPSARNRLLEVAVNKLRQRLAAQPEDPTRLTDLGEALASLPKHHKEARIVLERLAARDLVTTAHGYAALSRLRGLIHDESGAKQALDACRKLDQKGVACPAAAAPKA
jgi:hypothetical protein